MGAADDAKPLDSNTQVHLHAMSLLPSPQLVIKANGGTLAAGRWYYLVLQIENIDKDDYFAKNAEFTAWLREQRGKFFNEMDSDETRALFGRWLNPVSHCSACMYDLWMSPKVLGAHSSSSAQHPLQRCYFSKPSLFSFSSLGLVSLGRAG